MGLEELETVDVGSHHDVVVPGMIILPRYTPSGRNTRPPPASTTAFRHAENASVLSVLSSPAAPWFRTLNPRDSAAPPSASTLSPPSARRAAFATSQPQIAGRIAVARIRSLPLLPGGVARGRFAGQSRGADSALMRSASQTFTIDCRVTPMRFASRSSDWIIQVGKSTLTRRCDRPGRSARSQSRNRLMSSPVSNRRSNSLALIVSFCFAISCPPCGNDPNAVPSDGEHARPQPAVELTNQRESLFIHRSCRHHQAPWILPQRLGSLKVDSVFLAVRVRLGLVILKHHIGIITIPFWVSRGNSRRVGDGSKLDLLPEQN